jgi:hypothetical protein
MSKFYDVNACLKKGDKHWELAGLARQDGDSKDEERHTKLARLWDQRAKEGGYEEESK